MEVLTSNLYKASPTRKLSNPVESAWLEQTYKFNKMHAKWKRADELTLIGGFCGYQFKGTADPLNPLKIILWGAEEIAFWVDADDPLVPVYVAVKDRDGGRNRLRLYSDDMIVTFVTEETASAWGTFTEVKTANGRITNPYRDIDGKGIIPFSFCHWFTPTQVFTTDGPGYGLAECNDFVNADLDSLGDAKAFLCKPLGVASGVDATWVPPVQIRPGDFINLPASDVDLGGTGVQPTLTYLMADLGFIAADWMDLNFYIDHVLEMNGVPPVLIRMIQSSARSGESIKAEQTPLIQWVEGRRSQWADFEDDTALMAVKVTAAHLRNTTGYDADAAKLQAIADDWQFTLRWPNLYTLTPGPERDLADDYRVERGYASKIMIVMERDGVTEIEAVEHLQKVHEQNEALKALGIEPQSPNQLAATQAAEVARQAAFDPDSEDDTDGESSKA